MTHEEIYKLILDNLGTPQSRMQEACYDSLCEDIEKVIGAKPENETITLTKAEVELNVNHYGKVFSKYQEKYTAQGGLTEFHRAAFYMGKMDVYIELLKKMED